MSFVYLCTIKVKKEKILGIALSLIFGINKKRAINICNELGYNFKLPLHVFSDKEIKRLIKYIESTYKINFFLKRRIFRYKKFLRKVDCYRSIRVQQGLPARGQRTRPNGRTARKMRSKYKKV